MIASTTVFVVLVVVMLKFLQNDQSKITKTTEPFKFSDNQAVNLTMQKVIKVDDTKKKAVPADNEKFSVTYHPDAKNFIVVIKVKPYETIKGEVVDWFKAQDFREADFCSLNVTFVAVKGVKDSFEPKDSVFDGCTVLNIPVKVSPPPGQKLAPINPPK